MPQHTEDGLRPALPHRGLHNRHVQFIAIGGAIGAGLFLGSGSAISAAGPAALLAYAICGVFVFLMARALGELALSAPASTPFVGYLTRHLYPSAGFVTGWTYWINWIVVGAAELTAAGLFVRFWFPALPQWVPVGIVFIGVVLINVRAVRVFGEAEFWLSLCKIVTILGLIATGLAILLLPKYFPVTGANVANLVNHGGFVPNGFAGIIQLLPVALFAFGGLEVVALTAREAVEPEVTIPRAMNGVIFRIVVFYLGTMAVLMSIAPWTSYSAQESPFVAMFQLIGIPSAAGIINLVVLTAVISSANTGLYATGRMLSGLAEEGMAPACFMMTDARGVPVRGILASGACLMTTVAINWAIPEQAFQTLLGMTSYFLLWVWTMVMIAHHVARRKPTRSTTKFILPFYPLSTLITLAFFAIAAVLLITNRSNLPATIAAAGWFACLAAAAWKWRTMMEADGQSPHPQRDSTPVAGLGVGAINPDFVREIDRS